MSNQPVIVAVAYRRAYSLKRLLSSLSNAHYESNDITLIISIDHHPDNGDVVKVAEDFKWEYGTKIVKTHSCNLGLKAHILECGDYAFQYGSVIILEDDEIVAPSFYEYTKTAHEFYDCDSRIAGISLYLHEWNMYAGKRFQPLRTQGDVFFGQFFITWGQSWSADQWRGFKEWLADNPEICRDHLMPSPIYGWNKSWGKFFTRYLIETEKYYVIPRKPVTTVYGEAGTHYKRIQYEVQTPLYLGNEKFNFLPFEDGCHYDLFFENIDIRRMLAEWLGCSENEVYMDLYETPHKEYVGAKYVLTTKQLKKAIVKTYELNLRPHESGVLFDMPGDGIYLYNMNSTDNSEKNKKNQERIFFDLGGIKGADALRYGICHCIRVIKDSVKR